MYAAAAACYSESDVCRGLPPHVCSDSVCKRHVLTIFCKKK